MSNKETEELNKLININKDACDFYKSAQEKTKSDAFKRTFQDLESLHQSVIINLKECVRANGDKPEVNDTFTGQATQLWGELMANISNDIDETLVKHLEEAEDRCLHTIEDAINEDEIKAATKTVLSNELSTLKGSHDYMKALKEALKVA